MKVVINLNFDLKNLDGSSIQPEANAGKIIATMLIGATTGDPLKFFDWAQDLNQQKELILDDSDKKTLYDFVKDHRDIFNIAKAPVMRAINDAKEYKRKI